MTGFVYCPPGCSVAQPVYQVRWRDVAQENHWSLFRGASQDCHLCADGPQSRSESIIDDQSRLFCCELQSFVGLGKIYQRKKDMIIHRLHCEQYHVGTFFPYHSAKKKRAVMYEAS